MSFENAKRNLEEFGKELKLEGLAFDENNTCILGIDDEFSLHLTYEPNTDRLYLYSPLLDGLPKDDKTLLKLYQRLLEGSMLGGQMAGGGVGVAVQEELILIHVWIEVSHAETSALRTIAPIFVDTVERWRKIVEDVVAGREPEPFKPGQLPGGGPGGSGAKQAKAPAAPQSSNQPGGGGGSGGGGGFIRG